MNELFNLTQKVKNYKAIQANTIAYRKIWKEGFRDQLIQTLTKYAQEVELDARVEVHRGVENLEAVSLSLGAVKSGMFRQLGKDIERHLIKQNGSLLYQQLFNGKIIVMINFPVIEGYEQQPRPPKTLAIYRPEELKQPYFIRHLEQFITDVTNWEDFDDDEPHQKIGYKFNFNNPSQQA